MRLVDVENPEALRIFNDFSYDMGLDSLSKLRVEPALTYDAVQLFARAFKQFQDAVKGNIKSLDCNGADNWELGASLSNILRSVRNLLKSFTMPEDIKSNNSLSHQMPLLKIFIDRNEGTDRYGQVSH